ncbi:MAG TPA: amidohydrolase family protein [Acidimicrobiia bacterium]|nr:amidohydrolase family protein [Acidimicrobiia bacterium]
MTFGRDWLPYDVFDADNHFYEPPDAYTRYLEPRYRDRAFTPTGSGLLETAAGEGTHLPTMFGSDLGEGIPTPGENLVKLNPLRGLDDEQRDQLLGAFREMRPAFENRARRLELMDRQGIEAALVYGGTVSTIEYHLHRDFEVLWANVRAYNRWLDDDWGYARDGRLYCPPLMVLTDVGEACKELDRVLAAGARIVQMRLGPAFGRSPADPHFDPFWARLNEAKIPLATHLGWTEYARAGSAWSEDPRASYFHYDAFQWLHYWGDRPAMETVSALIFHGLFERFPNLRVVFSEQGTVWVPYLVRKMDHAFLMGRRATFDQLTSRPSEIFQRHILVSPFPEESLSKVVEAVGTGCLAFGSDFPHGEGLPDPSAYETMLKGLSDDEVRRIMRDNLARFLGVDA